MSDEGISIDRGGLVTNIENTNLGIGDTTAETRLDERLILAITVATSRTTTHVTLSKGNLVEWQEPRPN